MLQTAEIIGKIAQEIYPEADNEYVALDYLLQKLYKVISIKQKASIDCRKDIEFYLFLEPYKNKIANMLAIGELRDEKHNNFYTNL